MVCPNLKAFGLGKVIQQDIVKETRRRSRQKKRYKERFKGWTGVDFVSTITAAEHRSRRRENVAELAVVTQREMSLGV